MDENFDELAAFMSASWSKNKEQALDYDSDFLRSVFEYPGSSFDLAPAIYRHGNLVAFIAGSPRNVQMEGHRLRLLSVSLLTVIPKHKRFGYGPLVYRELIDRARASGFDGTIAFCVEGDDMNLQMPALARLCRHSTRRVFSVNFMARLLPLKVSPPAVPLLANVETEIFLEAAARAAARVPFAKVWTHEEAEWQCHGRRNALTYAIGEEHRGILTGYYIKTLGAAMPCVIMDDILWGDLTPSECVTLVNGFLGNAAERGAQMVIAPILGYADITPLVATGFRKIRRLLHTYLTLWNGLPQPESFPAMYIDIF